MVPALLGSAIVGSLAAAMSSLVGRVLLAVGVTFVTYAGLDLLIDSLISRLSVSLGAVGSAAAWLVVLKIPTQISIISSAWLTRLTLATVDGTIKKAILK